MLKKHREGGSLCLACTRSWVNSPVLHKAKNKTKRKQRRNHEPTLGADGNFEESVVL